MGLAGLKWTSDLNELDRCDHFLLYLTSRTWTSGGASAAFAREVRHAQRLGVHVLLAHEYPSVIEDDSIRDACPFNDFWAADSTPEDLLNENNVYLEIAIALKPGHWRKAGLATLARKMVASRQHSRARVRHMPQSDRDSASEKSTSHSLARRAQSDSENGVAVRPVARQASLHGQPLSGAIMAQCEVVVE